MVQILELRSGWKL